MVFSSKKNNKKNTGNETIPRPNPAALGSFTRKG